MNFHGEGDSNPRKGVVLVSLDSWPQIMYVVQEPAMTTFLRHEIISQLSIEPCHLNTLLGT